VFIITNTGMEYYDIMCLKIFKILYKNHYILYTDGNACKILLHYVVWADASTKHAINLAIHLNYLIKRHTKNPW
jgi:hypothetical protein